MASLLDARPRSGAIPRRVHLVGAGGVHLSAIGQILLARGHIVTGSDLARSDYSERLQGAGGTVYHGHAPSNLGRAELVVATAAASSDNPELEAARERGVQVLSRAQMVQWLLAERLVLAVAGSHGKTTSTALLAQMAVDGGLDPLVLLGGDSPGLGGNARDGSGVHAVVEADEYAEAFLEYEPEIAIIANLEADHLDYYGSEERLRAAFAAFAERVRPDGLLLVGADSEAATRSAGPAAPPGRASSASASPRTPSGAPSSCARTTSADSMRTCRWKAWGLGRSRCACPAGTTCSTRSARSRPRCARASTSSAPRRRPRSSRARGGASSCTARSAA